jgi:hypothetical protein
LWIPLAIVASTLVFGPWALAATAVYPLQIIRLALREKRTPRESWARAVALVVCKFPEMIGQIRFKLDRMQRVQAHLIEYK